MTTLFACLTAQLMFLVSANAAACSLVRLPPADMLKTSSAVVIAAPIAVSYQPARAANTSFTGIFEQTVIWRISHRYKGELGIGETFSTVEQIDRNNLPCGISTEFHGKDARLLYVFGKSPSLRVYEVDLNGDSDYLKILGTTQ